MSTIAQCENDKELLRTELKAVKDAHVDKVQELSCSIARLQRKVAALQDVLKEHNITQGMIWHGFFFSQTWIVYLIIYIEPCIDDEAIDTMLINRECKDDAEFIKVSEKRREIESIDILTDYM